METIHCFARTVTKFLTPPQQLYIPMVTPQDYPAYHIMKAIGEEEATAQQIAERYNRWALRDRNPVTSVQQVALIIVKRLSPSYVVVSRREQPWAKQSGRGRNIYRLTINGLRWVERYAYKWDEP